MSDIRVPSQTRRLKEVTARHILESFKRLSTNSESSTLKEASTSAGSTSFRYGSIAEANLTIKPEQMQQLIRTCGGEGLRDFESEFLIKRLTRSSKNESSCDGITCRDFTKAVESYMNDAKTDPYALVLCLFRKKFGEGVGAKTRISRA